MNELYVETEALILNCIDKYNEIYNELNIIGTEIKDKNQLKKLLNIDGIQFYYELGKIKERYEQLKKGDEQYEDR